MSKEKQIEEMWNIITTDCNEECVGCEFENDNWCFTHRVINNLYNAGYRHQSHGTWYHGTESGYGYAKCSACGKKMNPFLYGYAYCALCGARMDGAKMKGGVE